MKSTRETLSEGETDDTLKDVLLPFMLIHYSASPHRDIQQEIHWVAVEKYSIWL